MTHPITTYSVDEARALARKNNWWLEVSLETPNATRNLDRVQVAIDSITARGGRTALVVETQHRYIVLEASPLSERATASPERIRMEVSQ